MAKSGGGKAQNSSKKGKGKLLSILTLILVITIITAVFAGVFYFIVFNNIGGVTGTYYASLKKIPVLNLALPEPPDPLNPKYMTEAEIKRQYLVYQKENEELKKQLDEANAKIDEYRSFREGYDTLMQEAGKKGDELDAREAGVQERERQAGELRKSLDELIANGDQEAYKAYFEAIDPENAKLIYEKFLKDQQAEENVRKLAQVYEQMDPASAATIYEQLGASKMDLIAGTIKAMKKENASEILASMTPDFAAKVTERLDELLKGN